MQRLKGPGVKDMYSGCWMRNGLEGQPLAGTSRILDLTIAIARGETAMPAEAPKPSDTCLIALPERNETTTKAREPCKDLR